MIDYIGQYKIVDGRYRIKRGDYQGLKIFKCKNLYDYYEEKPCYVPPESQRVYTSNDFVRICEGNIKIADKLFSEVYQCSPEDLLEIMIRQRRIGRCKECNKLIITRDEEGTYEFCENCGYDIVYTPSEEEEL